MKYGKLLEIAATTSAALVAIAASATPLAAQGNTPKHSNYRVVDLGTFGGPHSQFNFNSRILNRKGTAVGGASTSTPDPLCQFDSPYCFVFHAGKYENGFFSDLGSLPGGANSFAVAVNSAGVAVGVSENGLTDPVTGLPVAVAAAWKKAQAIDLGSFGGTFGIAVDINDRGEIAGGAENTIPDPDNLGGMLLGFASPTQWHAALWQNGTPLDLGTLGTGPDSFAGFVNKFGQVAGVSYTNSIVNPETGIPTVHPFLWQNGQMVDVGTLGGLFAAPSGLNDRGQVVGASDVAGDLTQHPFSWNRGVMTDLGTFGGDNGSAAWVNDAGDVVGEADFPGDAIHHGFVWTNGVLNDLKPVGSAPCSNAFSINSTGEVVGNSTNCPGTGLGAVLWENGSAIDLNSFIPPGSGISFDESVFIGDNGEIAVDGLINGNHRAFILVPDGDCDDACESRIAANQSNAISSQSSAAQKQGSDSLVNPASEFRNRLMQRYHRLGTRP